MLKPRESAELTAAGASLALPGDSTAVNVTVKVGGPQRLDYSDPLTVAILGAARWVTHDDEQAKWIAQYAIQTLAGK